jgi:hypothetical protein
VFASADIDAEVRGLGLDSTRRRLLARRERDDDWYCERFGVDIFAPRRAGVPAGAEA